MTEEESLIAAYADHPDESHRLVLADWFDDRGDPRGGWLRDAELARYMGPRVEHPAIGLIRAINEGDTALWQRLVELGPSAVPYILDEWQYAEPGGSRDRALDAIRDAVPGLSSLCERLASDDPHSPLAAIQAIGQLGEAGTAGLPALVPLFRDDRVSVRVAAAEAVCQFGRWVPASLRVLNWAVGYNDHHVRSVMFQTLEHLGPHSPAVDILLDSLGGRDSETASAILQRFGLAVADRILASFECAGANTSSSAIGLLHSLGVAVIPRLLQVSGDFQQPLSVRRGAIDTLGFFGENEVASNQDAAIIAQLIRLIDDPIKEVQRDALITLGHFGSAAEPAIPVLLRLLAVDRHRDWALEVLTAIGLAAAPASPAVRPLTRSEDPRVRRLAVQFIEAVGDFDH